MKTRANSLPLLSAFCFLLCAFAAVGAEPDLAGQLLKAILSADVAAMGTTVPVRPAFMPASNQPPIAVINILETPPELVGYALEPGLNTPVPRAIRCLDGYSLSLTHPVRAGKIYQVQFKFGIDAPWCCAFNDFIPAQDGTKTWVYPVFKEEPQRYFRVMSNE